MGSTLIQRGNARLIFGLGVTGVSLAKHLIKNAIPFHLVDSQAEPAQLPQLLEYAKEHNAQFEFTIGEKFEVICWDSSKLNTFIAPFHQLLVSPGVKLSHPLIQAAFDQDIQVDNDVGLFLHSVKHSFPDIKIVAITGSNGKSTVTDATGYLGKQLGLNCYSIGNIGTPVLDVLDDLNGDEVLIMELSSYQLELLDGIGADVALILNLSEDHLDRHGDMHHYWLAKQKIYEQAKAVVVNRDDPLTAPMEVHKDSKRLTTYIRYGLAAPDLNDFGLIRRENKEYLAKGVSPLVEAASFQLKGPHNLANLLAVLGIAECLGWPIDKSCTILQTYSGLEFRCQIEPTEDQNIWVNDSKGTNVGASLVALQNGVEFIREGAGLWWIAGGLTKGANFTEIAEYVKSLDDKGLLKGCLLYGQDKQIIKAALTYAGVEKLQVLETLDESVLSIQQQKQRGDAIIFSPACASMDQFKNYMERGRVFSELVRKK